MALPFQENVLMDVNTKMQPFKEFCLTKKVFSGSTGSNPHTLLSLVKNQAVEEK